MSCKTASQIYINGELVVLEQRCQPSRTVFLPAVLQTVVDISFFSTQYCSSKHIVTAMNVHAINSKMSCHKEFVKTLPPNSIIYVAIHIFNNKFILICPANKLLQIVSRAVGSFPRVGRLRC